MRTFSFRYLLRIAAAAIMLLGVMGASASADDGKVLWTADASRPWNQEWASWSCENQQRFSQVTWEGLRAYRFEVRDGDDSYGERCELGQGNPTAAGFPLFHEGEERWISWRVWLPNDLPVDTNHWQVVAQWKQLGSLGCPALAMHVHYGQFTLDSNSSDDQWSDPAVGPAIRNRWVQFTLHVKFSPNPAVGFVELYGDLDGRGQKLLLPLHHIYTMKVDPSTGETVPSHARIGIYRDPEIQGTSHIYYAGYTVATTKQAAEQSAFGEPAASSSHARQSSGTEAGDIPGTTPVAHTARRPVLHPGATRHVLLGAARRRLHRGQRLRLHGRIVPRLVSGARRAVVRAQIGGRWYTFRRAPSARGGFAARPRIWGPRSGSIIWVRASVAGIGRSRTLRIRVAP